MGWGSGSVRLYVCLLSTGRVTLRRLCLYFTGKNFATIFVKQHYNVKRKDKTTVGGMDSKCVAIEE